MRRKLIRFNGFEMKAMITAVKLYESLKRRRYDPERMTQSMNPDYWRDYLDEIGRARLQLRDAYEKSIDRGTKVRECCVNLTDAHAMIIEHAIDEWRRVQKGKELTGKELERFYLQEADAHGAELRLREAFREDRKAAV